MLTPEYLNDAPSGCTYLMQQLEDDILQDVARRIGQMGGITSTAEWQLRRLSATRALRKDIKRKLARYTGLTEKQIAQIMQEAGLETLAADDEIYRAAGKEPGNINDDPALVNILNAGYLQTANTWNNLTGTTADTVTRQFEDALDRAALQVSSGAFDYNTAIKKAVDGLAQHMAYVTYPTGHVDTLEVATRRAVLTGVNQMAAKLQLQRMDEMDCDFLQVTAHAGARPEHALWQGKIYHRGGTVTRDGVTYPDFVAATHYGSGDGLCGWNCRHNFDPYFLGMSKDAYSRKELKSYNARSVNYRGAHYTVYEISQMQRALERKVRAAKRLYLAEDAAGADTTRTAEKLKAARVDLALFVSETGSRMDAARVSVSGFGRSQSSKASAAARKAAAAAE